MSEDSFLMTTPPKRQQSDVLTAPGITDDVTGARVAVDYTHHEVHEGDTFSACYAADLGNGATVDFLMVTPNSTKYAHLVFEIISESECDFNVYEDATASSNGTAITSYNRNRNSSNVATTLAFHTPTVTGTGTLLCHSHWGSGKGTGGGDRALEEWVLKPNTKYLFRLTNATANNNYISAKAIWYEHTNVV